MKVKKRAVLLSLLYYLQGIQTERDDTVCLNANIRVDIFTKSGHYKEVRCRHPRLPFCWKSLVFNDWKQDLEKET
jgi:hypothetical protein